MKIKTKLLTALQASLIASGVGSTNLSLAATCASNTSPASDCTDLVINSNAGALVNNVTIGSTGFYAVRDTAGGTFSSFTNNGTINAGAIAGVSIGTPAGNFYNYGTIGGLSGFGGIALGGSASISTLVNAGSISPTRGNGIQNQVGSHIGSIINAGVIGSGSAYGIGNAGTIDTITNVGRISGPLEGIQNGGTIGVVNNQDGSLYYGGKLPGAYNVIIASATDYGQAAFYSVSGGPLNFGVQQAADKAVPLGTTSFPTVMTGLSESNVSSNTRSGNFSGAFNSISWNLSQAGTSQIWNLSTTASPITSAVVSGSSAATNLAGAFVLVANASAPVTTVNPVSTTTTNSQNTNQTGIPASATTQTTTSIFTPSTSAQSTVTTTTTTTSTTNGGVTTVSAPVTTTTSAPTVRPAAVPTTATSTVQTVVDTPSSTTQPITTTTTTATSTTQAPVGQTLANGTSLVAAVQGLTATQANQLTQVHAEGYSSNMTIGLEQMAHITNTVMDRIHAPMSSSPTTKVYQDDEGRYVWADAAAVKGTVNNNNNLSGFGYNLYDLIIGGDIKRTKDGGYGVFAGAGTTSMTESQQVTQNFNTTNFYAGLYGALNFAEQVKLSGAVGYMYGNTNANRSTPNVGAFTGGNATSSYKTNGAYAAAKLAKAYQFESITISPFVGASYSQLWMGGASEQGGNDFNFGINSATAYTAVTFAGADFIYPLLKGTNNPLSLIGFYKFGYDWFANSNSAHSITANSPIYGSFTQVGANMGPVSNMFGLGIQGGITKDVSARIGVVASANTYGTEYGGGAELRFKF